MVRHPDHGGTIISLNLSTVQVLIAIAVASLTFFGALYEATKYAFQPFVDSRIEQAQRVQAAMIDREYARKTDYEKLVAEKEERWSAQYRINAEISAMMSEIRADVKDLLRRQGRP